MGQPRESNMPSTIGQNPDANPPFASVIARTFQLWGRIRHRYERSHVWRNAPAQVLAVEFLSILRLLCAPCRIECVLYETLKKGMSKPTQRVLASTLPEVLMPLASNVRASVCRKFAFDTASFFSEGYAAVEKWYSHLPQDLPGEGPKVAALFKTYFEAFQGHATPIEFPEDPSLSLKVLATGNLDSGLLRQFVHQTQIGELVRTRQCTVVSDNNWRPTSRMLTDSLVQEYIDRMENDMAVSIGADVSEIWLLLPDESGTKLRFHTPPEKLQNLLRAKKCPSTVGKLRKQIEGDNLSGIFDQYLVSCEQGMHPNLHWDDLTTLTDIHLACLAEKFKDWPIHQGIAGNVVATGCSEIIRDFTKDYRVQTYGYMEPPPPTHQEAVAFYQAQLAESIFIPLTSDLVEIPLLWSCDAQNTGHCGALLLVLFDSQNAVSTKNEDFAVKAVALFEAAEYWQIILEQHCRWAERQILMQDHIFHDVRNESTRVKEALPKKYWKYLEPLNIRIELLQNTYSDHMYDEHLLEDLSVSDFVTFLCDIAKSLHQGRRKGFKYEIDSSAFGNMENMGTVKLPKSHMHLVLMAFLDQSASILDGFRPSDGMSADHLKAVLRVLPQASHSFPSPQLLRVEICHPIHSGQRDFLQKHRDRIGREAIIDEDRKTGHRGLFYLGATLRNCDGMLHPPNLNPIRDQGTQVTWVFTLPLHPKQSVTTKKSKRGNARE